jgi:iron(III) transport system substrate-binding protein
LRLWQQARTWTAKVAALCAVALALAACAPTAAPASPAPARAPASDAPTGASGSAPPAAPADWPGRADWEATVAAARAEGVVVVSGPSSDLWRNVLVTFEQDYPGIRAEVTAMNSRTFWPRWEQERKADQYLWDLRVGGPDPVVYEYMEAGLLEPVRPLLVLPEVVDDSKWLGGLDALFADKARRYIPAFNAQLNYPAFVNRDAVPEPEFASLEELVNPKWRGKITIQEPRGGGSGQGQLALFLAVYGEGFVRDLLTKQDIVATGDTRQLTEWVIRARYPIGVGVRSYDLLLFEQEGLKTNVRPVPRSATTISSGSAGIQLLTRAPHPNASKIFINWLLTQSAQERLSRAIQENSRRLDVAPGDPDSVATPEQAAQAIVSLGEDFMPMRRRAGELAAELLR